MRRHLLRGWWSLLDYAFVTCWQLAGLISRGGVDQFHAPPEQGRVRIVIVPGVYESWRFMRPLGRKLHRSGYAVHFVQKLGFNHGTITDMAHLVADYLAEHALTNVVLVTHSKGGLIGKYAMVYDDPARRIRAMVAVNTPFSGSPYARWVPLVAVRAFLPSDRTITALAGERSINARITSVFSRFDPHIPGGSSLVGAVNAELATAGHFRALSDPNLVPLILAAIQRSEAEDGQGPTQTDGPAHVDERC